MGELFNERSGFLTWGSKGFMTAGAMTGFTVTYLTGSLWLGVAAAASCGVLFSLLLGFLTITLGLSQHVSGIGVTFFGTGVSYYIYRLVVGTPSVPPVIDSFQPVVIPCWEESLSWRGAFHPVCPGLPGRFLAIPFPGFSSSRPVSA